MAGRDMIEGFMWDDKVAEKEPYEPIESVRRVLCQLACSSQFSLFL